MFSGIECRCICQGLISIPHLATNHQWQMLHSTLSSRQTAEVIVVTQHQEHRPHTGSPDSSLFIIAMATTGDKKTMYLSPSAQSVSPTQSYRKLFQNIKYRLRLLLNTHLQSSHTYTHTHTHIKTRHLATNHQWQKLHRTLSSRQTAGGHRGHTQHQEHCPHTGSPDSSLFIITMATTGDKKPPPPPLPCGH